MAAGGGCVARAPDGRVVFVRHAVPGERVRARVTEEASRFLRADAVEVLDASPDRAQPPCPHAGPGRCGGCDWQHVRLEAQRRLKQDLVAAQLRHLAGTDADVRVEEVPGPVDGLAWRSRARFAVDQSGRLGFHLYRSHQVEPVTQCLVASAQVEAVGAERARWPGAKEVEVLALSRGALCRVEMGSGAFPAVDGRHLPGLGCGLVVDGQPVRGTGWVEEQVEGRRFRVTAGSFWQVHVGAPRTLALAVIDGLVPQPGDFVADLYAGVGLMAVLLAGRVGPTGRVLAVERSPRAHRDSVANTAGLPQVRPVLASVTPRFVSADLGHPDLVVLDPARRGAGTATMAALARLRPPPRAVAYLSCYPATFARDVSELLRQGWSLQALRAFDLFPMTEHVEVLGLLVPGPLATGGRALPVEGCAALSFGRGPDRRADPDRRAGLALCRPPVPS